MKKLITLFFTAACMSSLFGIDGDTRLFRDDGNGFAFNNYTITDFGLSILDDPDSTSVLATIGALQNVNIGITQAPSTISFSSSAGDGAFIGAPAGGVAGILTWADKQVLDSAIQPGDSPEFEGLTVDGDIGIGSGVITFSTGDVISLEEQFLIDGFDTGDEQLTWNADGVTILGNQLDLNGAELILDADGDTSITADNNDQIDIRVGGNDVVTIDSDGITIGDLAFIESHIKWGTNNIIGTEEQLLIDGATGNTSLGWTADGVEISGDIGIRNEGMFWGNNLLISLEEQILIDGTNNGGDQLSWGPDGIRLATGGATVNKIATTVEDSDTDLPTSGAVVDYVADAGPAEVPVPFAYYDFTADNIFAVYDTDSDYINDLFVFGNGENPSGVYLERESANTQFYDDKLGSMFLQGAYTSSEVVSDEGVTVIAVTTQATKQDYTGIDQRYPYLNEGAITTERPYLPIYDTDDFSLGYETGFGHPATSAHVRVFFGGRGEFTVDPNPSTPISDYSSESDDWNPFYQEELPANLPVRANTYTTKYVEDMRFRYGLGITDYNSTKPGTLRLKQGYQTEGTIGIASSDVGGNLGAMQEEYGDMLTFSTTRELIITGIHLGRFDGNHNHVSIVAPLIGYFGVTYGIEDAEVWTVTNNNMENGAWPATADHAYIRLETPLALKPGDEFNIASAGADSGQEANNNWVITGFELMVPIDFHSSYPEVRPASSAFAFYNKTKLTNAEVSVNGRAAGVDYDLSANPELVPTVFSSNYSVSPFGAFSEFITPAHNAYVFRADAVSNDIDFNLLRNVGQDDSFYASNLWRRLYVYDYRLSDAELDAVLGEIADKDNVPIDTGYSPIIAFQQIGDESNTFETQNDANTVVLGAAMHALTMGAKEFKFAMSNNDSAWGLPNGTLDVLYDNVTEMAQGEYVAPLLDLPFEEFHMWFSTWQPDWKFNVLEDGAGISDTLETNIYNETRTFVEYLRNTYDGTGKKFFLGNWEGDWMLSKLDGNIPADDEPWGGPNNSPDDLDAYLDRAAAMIEWANARQSAINDAKAATPGSDVEVWYYVEANKTDWLVDGKECVLKDVVPYVTGLDYVSLTTFHMNTLEESEVHNRFEQTLLALDSIATVADIDPNNPKLIIGEAGLKIGQDGALDTFGTNTKLRDSLHDKLTYPGGIRNIFLWKFWDDEDDFRVWQSTEYEWFRNYYARFAANILSTAKTETTYERQQAAAKAILEAPYGYARLRN
jgi:hypothetical protein